MTAREVTECAKRIMKRRNEEARFDAKIHGAVLKEEKDAGKPLNPEQKKIASTSMDRMVREKQEEIAKRKQGMMNVK